MDKTAPILVVDDYMLIRTSVRSILGELGYSNVYQADNGKTAQDLMRKEPMAAVICDWNMPLMNGLELLEWMRTEERYAKVPFMLLTAETNRELVRSALAAGVTAYLVKPFTFQSFVNKFQLMVGADASQGASAQAQAFPFARFAGRAENGAPQAPRIGPKVVGLHAPLDERLRQSTVLIVDDTPNNIEVMAGVLKDEYTIKVAISGKKALEIAAAVPVDIILLDIMMPVMDGFEVCRRLKADPATAHIPVIFLSAKNSVADVVSGFQFGAVDYVAKPVDPTILKARLSTHLMLSKMLADLKRQNAVMIDNAQLREDVDRMTQHDLKSPLTVALQGAHALLTGEPLSPAQQEKLEMIQQAAGNALEMINRTFDLYRIESGNYQPKLESFDLGALLSEVTQHVEMAFAGKQVAIVFPAEIEEQCLGERSLCYSLFSNLLKNAVEASPEGEQVTIEAAPGYQSVHVVINNAGEVPAAMRECFFEKYTTMGKEGGTGLGTYSAKLMAELQGGGIVMGSDGGHTRLTVTLRQP